MTIKLTYADWYGEHTDGGAQHICCECMGGWQCVAQPQAIIRNFKNLLCPDCAKRYAADKQEYRNWVKQQKILYKETMLPLFMERVIKTIGVKKVKEIIYASYKM